MKMLVLSLTIIMSVNVCNSLLDTSGALLSRRKRTLVYQPGLNWVQMVVGIGLPIEIKEHSITMGVAVKSYYELPNNSTIYTHPTIDYARGKRSTSRWDFYYALQHFAEREYGVDDYLVTVVVAIYDESRACIKVDDTNFGFSDGKSCLLRTICESASAPFDGKTGLLSEVLHLIFTPSTTEEPIECRFDYEFHAAEKLGKEARNCELLFPCRADFMRRFTKVFM